MMCKAKVSFADAGDVLALRICLFNMFVAQWGRCNPCAFNSFVLTRGPPSRPSLQLLHASAKTLAGGVAQRQIGWSKRTVSLCSKERGPY